MKRVQMETKDKVNLRYMVKDVESSIQFYTQYLGFTLLNNFAPAFADLVKGNLRLLLSGSTSSAGRNMPDGATPTPGGWNRFQVIVSDINIEVAKLNAQGLKFRNEIVKGPGGSQILLIDPSGNLIEIFEPAQQ
jgi:catechol 2,3-dioxygenase-like lactoylglutathione lyase family enzyme